MKITVITGSPHKKVTSALLADKFIEESGICLRKVYTINKNLY